MVHTYIHTSLEKLDHMIMEAEESQDKTLTSWSPQDAGFSTGLETSGPTVALHLRLRSWNMGVKS